MNSIDPARKGLSARVGNHIRGHVVGYVALFVALSGVAYADDGPLAGQNTVGSADIINAEVYAQDIRPDAVGSGKVADNSLTAADLAAQSVRFGELASSAFYAPDIAPLPRGIASYGIPINAIQGSEIQSDTIRRSDLAASAEAPAGFSFSDNDTGIICNGGCTEGTLHVPSGTFAVFGKIRVRQSDSDAEWLSVQCDLTTNGVSFDHSESVIEGEAPGFPATLTGTATLSMQGVRTFNQGDPISIDCLDHDVGDVDGSNLKIMAIRLGTLN